MAGSQNIGEDSDNPVGINVTAMVDVIFCLCLFFMCSFQFKQLEGKIESWLPRDAGAAAASADRNVLEEIRIIMTYDSRLQSTVRRVGNNAPTASDGELMKKVLSLSADYERLGKKDFPVLLEAARDVAWKDVVHVMDLLKQAHLDRIEFAGGAKPAPKSS